MADDWDRKRRQRIVAALLENNPNLVGVAGAVRDPQFYGDMARNLPGAIASNVGFPLPTEEEAGASILASPSSTSDVPMPDLQRKYAPDELIRMSQAYDDKMMSMALLGMTGAEKAAKDLHASKVARVRNRVETTGQMVGAPKGVTSPQKVQGVVNQYGGRVERALDAGVEPGWFYGKGSEAIKRVSDTPQDAWALARGNAITSSEAPVETNFGWAVKGAEQHAMGVPIKTGRYPTEIGKRYAQVLRGEDPYLGHKRERYSLGLQGEGGLAPNDRWEIRSMGFGKDAVAPTQASWMDEVRQRAVNAVNKRRGLNLTPQEAQELNWATYRADQLGIPIEKSAADNIQNAIPKYTFRHSWESIPGESSGHLAQLRSGSPEEWASYHEAVKGAILDSANKDQLIRGMGSRYQEAAYDAPGYFKGQIAPGTQSSSLVARTQAHGLDPASNARVTATEMARALFLGQDAAAGHIPIPAKSLKATDTVVTNIGRKMTQTDLQNLTRVLDKEFGAGNVAPVATPNGVNLLNVGVGKDFGKRMKALEPALDAAIGSKAQYAAATRAGMYAELPWKEKGATQAVINALRSPDAPLLAEHASSEGVRQVAGRLAGLNERLAQKGITPNPDLQRLLRAWADGGLPAAEDLVKRGLAPAIGLLSLKSLLSEQGGQGN